MRVARLAGAVVVLALAQSLTACTTEHVCVSPHWYDSVDELADDADLVVTGQVIGTDGTERLYALDATVHVVEVDRVLKGDIEAGELRVVSTPETCSGGRGLYPDGDPLDTDDEVQMFLHRDKTFWRTQTSLQGVVPIPADGTLPWDGPEPDD